MAGKTRPTLSGVGLIALCFLGSGLMRLSDDGWALAQGIGELARGEDADAPAPDPEALLAAIREREAQLAAEEARLADRRQTLNVAEEKLAEQLAAFEKAQENLTKTLALADEAAERDIQRMTTIYENMKPDDAARIFDRMEVSFAAGLLSRMQPDIAAEVMTEMEPDSAYAVTVTIASRNAAVPKE